MSTSPVTLMVARRVAEGRYQEMIAWLKEVLEQQGRVSFFALTDQVESLADLVGLFLAILELAKDQYLKVRQKRRFGDLEIERSKHDE